MIDLRRSMDQALDAQLANAYPHIKRLVVRQDTTLAWAGAERVPIMEYAPKCKGAEDLCQIVEWVKYA
jgi:chromosome partitioning protein